MDKRTLPQPHDVDSTIPASNPQTESEGLEARDGGSWTIMLAKVAGAH